MLPFHRDTVGGVHGSLSLDQLIPPGSAALVHAAMGQGPPLQPNQLPSHLSEGDADGNAFGSFTSLGQLHRQPIERSTLVAILRQAIDVLESAGVDGERNESSPLGPLGATNNDNTDCDPKDLRQ